jgi:CO/xanthine dehydrogenase FAD-binding subunit
MYLRPAGLDEALAALANTKLTVLAGGTDYYPARVGKPIDDDILDISAISSLRGIHDEGHHWRIGATATWSDIIAAELPPLFDGLKLAACEIGGVQIQNAGTVAGNLCNASPAADGAPPLLVLEAEVELASIRGVRRMPLSQFFVGNRRTLLAPDEVLTAVCLPTPSPNARSTFLKLGVRRYLVISIAMVAILLDIDGDGIVHDARVAVGACSAVAQRLPLAESALTGRVADASLGATLREEHLAALAPIDDVRASANYRRSAALILVRRAIETCVRGETGGIV